jgi:hypothetical protein
LCRKKKIYAAKKDGCILAENMIYCRSKRIKERENVEGFIGTKEDMAV